MYEISIFLYHGVLENRDTARLCNGAVGSSQVFYDVESLAPCPLALNSNFFPTLQLDQLPYQDKRTRFFILGEATSLGEGKL